MTGLVDLDKLQQAYQLVLVDMAAAVRVVFAVPAAAQDNRMVAAAVEKSPPRGRRRRFILIGRNCKFGGLCQCYSRG